MILIFGGRKLAKTIAELSVALDGLKTSVDALIAKPAAPADVQAEFDKVAALKAEVDAALAPPAPPAQ